ncbi:hypothetical protein [Actinomadura gamaensis]|uniref:Uncharacterized protein n=1 Tax=Actinomadura gamaensis TaxID=1763541 RepID=A0ABV9TRA2_9ACTN
MIRDKSNLLGTLVVIALLFYVFNAPESAGRTVNKALHSATTFFSAVGSEHK